MNNQHDVLRSLPYIASVLGKRYGMKIEIHGKEAYTNGKTIVIPSLPIDCNETFVNMVRGYIDHEASHIRETDFSILKECRTRIEHHLFNIFEDVRVERKLGNLYPGCRSNMRWLAIHLFQDVFREHDGRLYSSIMNHILLTARSWDVPELQEQARLFGQQVEVHIQGLGSQIAAVLARANARNTCSADSLAHARDVIEVLKQHVPPPVKQKEEPSARVDSSNQPPEQKDEQAGNASGRLPEDENPQAEGDCAEQIEQLLAASQEVVLPDMGRLLQEMLGQSAQDSADSPNACVVLPTECHCTSDITVSREHLEIISAMKTRLQALLQAKQLKRVFPGRRGKLDPQRLHTLATGGARVFRRESETIGMNTAFHIALDTSGSMSGKRINLATDSCYIVARALECVGVNVGITGFKRTDIPQVYPLVRHGNPVTVQMSLQAYGGTPLGETLWYIMGQMLHLHETRKIVLLLTDGDPDVSAAMQKSIKDLQAVGIEVYGIGIMHDRLGDFLDAASHICIESIEQLLPAMFTILRRTMLH